MTNNLGNFEWISVLEYLPKALESARGISDEAWELIHGVAQDCYDIYGEELIERDLLNTLNDDEYVTAYFGLYIGEDDEDEKEEEERRAAIVKEAYDFIENC